MKRPPRRTTAVAALLPLLAASAACSTPHQQPTLSAVPAPAASAVPASPAAATAESRKPTAESRSPDARFMQGMIHHHAQALEMVALIPSRTAREDMRLLGQRIDVSQRDEIALMRHWLQDHHEDAPDPEAHAAMHAMHHDSTGHAMTMPMAMDMPAMPGMLTPDEMAQLAKATGTAFDRLLLCDMIHHHEGALKMVADLLATPGAGQDSQVFRFASDVEADQRAEIARMQALLAQLPKE